MSVPMTYVAPDFATAPQLSPQQMPEVAAAGFRTVINNRPDGEGGPQQPSSAALQQAAEAAGLRYEFLPVQSGHITQNDAVQLARILESAPGPMLAFCRSGARSTVLYRAAQGQKAGAR